MFAYCGASRLRLVNKNSRTLFLWLVWVVKEEMQTGCLPTAEQAACGLRIKTAGVTGGV